MISTRQLHYFVEIADSGGFSAASERLFIAQSALSRQIKELESELDTALFERTARQPRLTAAGEAFLARARAMLAELNKASMAAREIGRGQRGLIRLSHSSTVPLTGELLATLKAYLADQPGVSVDVAQQSSEAQLLDIHEQRLDVGLLRLPVLRQREGLVLQPLLTEPLRLAVAADHRLAQRGTVSLKDLAEEPFVSIPHSQRGGLSYLSAQLCMEAGFFPRAAQVLSRKTTQLQLIQAGFGVALLPLSMAALAPVGVTLLGLEEACQSTVALAYRRDASPLMVEFCRAMAATPAIRPA